MVDENEVKDLAVEVLKTLIGQGHSGLDIFSNSRSHRADLERVMKEYGRTFMAPPRKILDYIIVIKINKKAFAVTIPFWTEEEGRSDLSLELMIKPCSKPPGIEIDDCRVL